MDVDLDGLFTDNSTFDYDGDYEYKEDFETKANRLVWIPLLSSVGLILGLLGNGLLLAVLARKRRSSWSLSDTFVLQLSASDVLLLLTLPYWAARDGQYCGWCYGGFLCKITGIVFKVNFYCGVLLLAFISLDCYLSMAHASQLFSRKSPRLAHVSCLCVWIFSLILTLPDWVNVAAVKTPTQETKTWCGDYTYSRSLSHWQLVSRVLHHALGFLLPTAALTVCCVCILLRLQQGSSPGLQDTKKKEKTKAVMVLLPLVAVFFLCWTPYNFALIVETYRGGSGGPGVDSSLKTALMVTSVLGCLHACLRPLLYLGLCGNFRRRALALLTCAAAEREGSLWELGVGEEALPAQSHEVEELNQTKSADQQVDSNQC